VGVTHGSTYCRSAEGAGGNPPCCSRTATHILMHASQIYTDGPATSRATSSSLLPQNEQRSPDSGRNRRAMPASFVKEPIALYPRFAPSQQPRF
jgi:hypothetical protein